MASISSYSSSSINTLFSSLSNSSNNKKSSSSDLLGINYNDYSSIRSGSYYKLLKNYYSESGSSSISSTSTSKDTTQTLSRIESKAESMKTAADKLLKKGTNSVFNKTDITDADGNTTYGYDKDKIYSAVSDFVDKYNSLIDSASESNVTGILTQANSMVSASKANAGLLSQIGITIDEDNKLIIDETKFKKADMEKVKSLFNTTGSYGYQISSKASMIDYYAQNEASKSNTYSKSGMYTYNYNTGNLYSSST